MENYRINSDGTRTEIKGIELFCELHPTTAKVIIVALYITFFGGVIYLFG